MGYCRMFPNEKGGQTQMLVNEAWSKCERCGYVPKSLKCPYCRGRVEDVTMLLFVPEGTLMVTPGSETQ